MSGEGTGSGSVQDGTSAHVGPVVAGSRSKVEHPPLEGPPEEDRNMSGGKVPVPSTSMGEG